MTTMTRQQTNLDDQPLLNHNQPTQINIKPNKQQMLRTSDGWKETTHSNL